MTEDTMQDATDQILKTMMARRASGTPIAPIAPIATERVQRAQDSGNDYMTPEDLACYLQTDVKSVRRQTETRAQQRAKFPMPFFKLNGKLRFERKKIQEWLQNIANSAPTFKPAKRGRPRKTKLQ